MGGRKSPQRKTLGSRAEHPARRARVQFREKAVWKAKRPPTLCFFPAQPTAPLHPSTPSAGGLCFSSAAFHTAPPNPTGLLPHPQHPRRPRLIHRPSRARRGAGTPRARCLSLRLRALVRPPPHPLLSAAGVRNSESDPVSAPRCRDHGGPRCQRRARAPARDGEKRIPVPVRLARRSPRRPPGDPAAVNVPPGRGQSDWTLEAAAIACACAMPPPPALVGWAGVSLVGGGRGVRVRARGAVVSIFLFFWFRLRVRLSSCVMFYCCRRKKK